MDEQQRESIEEDASHINRLIVLTVVAGMACLLLGFAIEARLPRFIDWLYAVAGWPAEAGHGADAEHGLDLTGVVTLLCKELGVAFLVAAIVALVVEKAAKTGDSRRVAQFIDAVSGHVIMGVYRLRHDAAFVEAAVETNLEAPVVREDMALRYKVRTLTADEASTLWPNRPDDALQRFVMLEMVSHYRFKNVSADQRTVDVRYVAALRQGKGARLVTKATYVKIGGRELTPAEIEGGWATACQRITDEGGTIDPRPAEKDYVWPRALAPSGKAGDQLEVLISVQVLKERSDNEVWGSFYPTMGDVTLSLEVLPEMHFGVRELSNGTLEPVPTNPAATSRTWYLRGPTLRHNSIVFWWRSLEDDADEDAESAPLEASDPAPPLAMERKSWGARLLDVIAWRS